MDVPSYFEDFLRDIRPTPDQRARMAAAHRELKELLENDPTLAPILIATFIQGSYRRHTGLLGTKEHQCDVDLVVVTNVPSATPPAVALELFRPFLERHYKGRYEAQGRSWCIYWDKEITLDLVPTSAPSEASTKFFRALGGPYDFDEPFYELSTGKLRERDPLLEAFRKEAKGGWQAEPLEIPDREAKVWEKTHPLAQIAWAAQKNANCGGHYINVVRAVKWWRRMKEPLPKYPKGYPLEHLVGACCPDGIATVAEGVARSLDAIINNYRAHVVAGTKPYLKDHGVEQDVFNRVSAEDFAGFYHRVRPAEDLARRARAAETVAQSVALWRHLFGDPFPTPPEEKGEIRVGSTGGFTPRCGPTAPSGGRFA